MTVPSVGAGSEAPFDLVVTRRTEEADGVVALELRDPRGGELPAWRPGAHVDLLLGPDLVRQYSLCSDPGDSAMWRIAVLREPDGRGGSRWVHDRLREGFPLRVRGPRNRFPLQPATRYLFIAGGIGITLILPMTREAARRGADWRLVYGGRSRAAMAFRELLESTGGGRVSIHPDDERGPLDLDGVLGRPDPRTLVYCCGPEGLMKAVERRCADWPPGALHVERFQAGDLGARVLDGPFEVELARSGVTVTVPPEKSVLESVEEAGVTVLSSCREGTCGTCETPVLDGTVDHRDCLLTPEEQARHDSMMLCVSRAACPRLVLDL
ncbi:PDR/VanB family oxidoreductase [Streptomyces sp. B21-108]|jgi:ferredoxin-NADP reductase|uniref:PDR/VanB family oxidoreductase n=1 Tax=Streptomyces sp. B21-108 TaxID=3039419 RepID=UPI002FF3DE33